MPLYRVNVETTVVVFGEDEDDAYNNIKDDIQEIDRGEFTVMVGRKVKKLEDLPNDWDGECLPYGGDGSSRIKSILSA